MRIVRSLLISSACFLSSCSVGLLSAYESQETYVQACEAYRRTGDEIFIQVNVGKGETAPLECADYLPDQDRR